MTSSHPLPLPYQGFSSLAASLDRRSAPGLAMLAPTRSRNALVGHEGSTLLVVLDGLRLLGTPLLVPPRRPHSRFQEAPPGRTPEAASAPGSL
jgi:hypothetical protein